MVESIYSPELVRINIADKTEDDPFMLQSGEFCLAETLELFNLPDDISCQFVLKSSRARDGLNHLLAGWCDPGWNGSKLTLELKNERLHHALPLWPGSEDRSDGVSRDVQRPNAKLRRNRALQQPLDSHAVRGMN